MKRCYQKMSRVIKITMSPTSLSPLNYRLMNDISTRKFYVRNKHTAFDVENCYFGQWITAWCRKLLQGCKKGCFGNFLIWKELWWLIKLPMIFAWLRFSIVFSQKLTETTARCRFDLPISKRCSIQSQSNISTLFSKIHWIKVLS